MFGEVFYHHSIWNLISAFGTLFNEIILVDYNSDWEEVSRAKVPITFAQKQKSYQRNTDDPDLDKQVSVVLPRMGFSFPSMMPNPEARLNRVGQNISQSTPGTYNKQLNPTPWIVNIDLTIKTKDTTDMVQILERILPHFTPQYTLTAKSMPELDLKEDIHLLLKDVNTIDTYDGSEGSRRVIESTIRFDAFLNFYGKITTQGVIRQVQTDFLVPKGAITPESMAVTPRSARIFITTDPADAEPDSDYEVIKTITEYEDGKKFNPETLEDEPIPEDE